jgi:PAS domain S-box-containing protein
MNVKKLNPEGHLTEKISTQIDTNQFSDNATRRQKAEELLRNHTCVSSRDVACNVSTEVDAHKLNHELKVHQIELELQNIELIKAKEQAVISAAKYIELYDFAPVGYFTLTRKSEIIELNFSGAKMLGKERSRLKDRRFGIFVSDNDRPIFNNFIDKVFSSSTKELCEIRLLMEDSSPIFVHLSGIANENRTHCLVNMIDITKHIEQEAAIKHKNKELLRINTEKNKFFSIIAHDLRSPFNGLLGLTEILVQRMDSTPIEELQKIASLLRKSATNVFCLLGNLLEWSKMQSGLTSFVPSHFLLLSKIDESMLLVQEEANKKEIAISYDIPNYLEVFADAFMFGSVIRNLTFNAVKFTPRGGKITISAISTSDNMVEISVMDTGIGMNKKVIDNLFRLDSNVNRNGTEDELSTGLGLIICKDFIGINGGKLRGKSKEGIGSTFIFSLPMNPINS